MDTFDILKTHYIFTVDWTGKHICELHIDWNHDRQYIDISMPIYLHDVLQRFQQPHQKTKKWSPMRAIPFATDQESDNVY